MAGGWAIVLLGVRGVDGLVVGLLGGCADVWLRNCIWLMSNVWQMRRCDVIRLCGDVTMRVFV